MGNNTTKKRFHYNYLSIAIIYLWSLVFIIAAGKIKDPESRMFPYIICGFAIVMATLLLIRTIMRSGIHAKLPDFTGTKSALVIAALLIAYVAVIEVVGFYIATPIYMYATMWVLGQRKQKVMILYSVLTSIGVYVFFKLLLGMAIPMGMLGELLRNM